MKILLILALVLAAMPARSAPAVKARLAKLKALAASMRTEAAD